jgi:hypothetical protein
VLDYKVWCTRLPSEFSIVSLKTTSATYVWKSCEKASDDGIMHYQMLFITNDVGGGQTLFFFHCCISYFKLILRYLSINSFIAYQTHIFKFPTHLCLEALF